MPFTNTASCNENASAAPSVLRLCAAAWVITSVLILSNAPTPLYVRWQIEIGFSATTLTAIFSSYMLGLLLTLLIAGQLADRFGRRTVLLPGLVVAVLATILFGSANSIGMLLAARFLAGIGIGVVLSAGIAAIVDLGGTDHRKQAAQIASMAMVVGAGLGPLLSGSLAHVLSRPTIPIFGIELALLLSAVISTQMFLPRGRTNVARSPPLRMRLPSVPRANRRDLASGIAVFAPGLTATSFVLSLGPSVLTRILGTSNPLLAGGLACAMFFVAAGVQLAPRNLAVRSIFLLGAAATALAMGMIAIALIASSAVALVIAAILAGSGQGLGQLGALTLIGLHVHSDRRAEATALLNIGGYVPAGFMPIATGYLIDAAGFSIGIAFFTGVVATLAICAGTIVSRRL